MSSTSKFKNLPVILGLIAIIPVMVVMVEYWYIKDSFFQKDPILDRKTCWIIALGCGALAGLLFNWNRKHLATSLAGGAIAGLIVGASSIWITGGYLWLRGFPDSLYKAEFILIAVILILIGVGVLSLLNKLQGTR